MTEFFKLNLGAVEAIFTPYWFSINGSETVKPVGLWFCSIQYLFIRGIHAKFGILNSPQSSDFAKMTDKSNFSVHISGQISFKQKLY